MFIHIIRPRRSYASHTYAELSRPSFVLHVRAGGGKLHSQYTTVQQQQRKITGLSAQAEDRRTDGRTDGRAGGQGTTGTTNDTFRFEGRRGTAASMCMYVCIMRMAGGVRGGMGQGSWDIRHGDDGDRQRSKSTGVYSGQGERRRERTTA